MLISVSPANRRIGDLEDSFNSFVATKDQPGGFLGIDGSGSVSALIIHRTGTATQINAIVLQSGEIAITTDTHELRIGDGATSGGLPVVPASTSTIVIYGKGSETENGTALGAAYAAAKLLTPHGSALSTTNRARVVLQPGTYDTQGTTGSPFLLDTNFVDIIGSGSMTTTIKGNLRQSCTDIKLRNFAVNTTIFVLTNPNSVAMTANVEWDDILSLISNSTSVVSITSGATFLGTYRRVRCPSGTNAFFGSISGYTNAATFEDCEGQDWFGNTAGQTVFTGALRRCRHLGTQTFDCTMGGLMWGCDWNVGLPRLASTAKILYSRFTPASGYSINHNATGMTASIAHCSMKLNGNASGINSTNVTNNLADTTNVHSDSV